MIPISHVLYALALLASYALLFGVIGIFAALIVVAIWALVFYTENRPKALFRMLAYLIVGAVLYGILSPARIQEAREAARRSSCKNNLKWLGIALHNYHETYDSFPPAYVADENGKPMHSWRVLILPYLDQMGLYRAYDFSKPWDSPENRELLKHMPRDFVCPTHVSLSEEAETTSYVAIVGPETAWPNSKSTRLRDCLDGPSQTILLIESNSLQIPWTAPVDLTREEAIEALASTDIESFDGHRYESFLYEYFSGRNVLLMDGAVRFVPFGADGSITSNLMTINDQKPERNWDGDIPGTTPAKRLKWGNVIGLLAMIVLTLLPLPWVWSNPTDAMNHADDPQGVESATLPNGRPEIEPKPPAV